MELKKWNEYSLDEKNELLLHWWHYFGKSIYTFDELERFRGLIVEKSDQIFNFATIAYLANESSRILLEAMRKNVVDKILELTDFSNKKDKKTKTVLENASASLIVTLVNTYNDPEPDIPLKEEDLKKQILELINRQQ